MNDKAKHFIACFLIALLGFTQSLFAGIYAATLCALLREYDRYIYTGHQDTMDMVLDLLADAAGIALALIIGGLYGKQ